MGTNHFSTIELLINISLVIQKQEHAIIKLEEALEDNSMESLM